MVYPEHLPTDVINKAEKIYWSFRINLNLELTFSVFILEISFSYHQD